MMQPTPTFNTLMTGAFTLWCDKEWENLKFTDKLNAQRYTSPYATSSQMEKSML